MSMITRTLFILAALGLALPAAGQSIDAGRGEVPVTVPAGYDADSPVPLIVLLHGYGASGEGQDRYFGVSEIADDYGFIMVAPDGTPEPNGRGRRFWNGSEACCHFGPDEIDDVAYLDALIDAVEAEWAVDPRRIYLIGHSNGGFMSYRMAYERSERIAAIASLAGASRAGMPEAPAAPVNILQIHGTADEVIAYAGGEIQENRYPGARATVAQWARYNGCAQPGRAREMRDLDASLPGFESGALVYTVGCAPGGTVALWTIAAGGHSPPLSESFAAQVVEWLYAHPKPAG